MFSLKYCLGESLAKLVQILPVVGKAIGNTNLSVSKELALSLHELEPLCSPNVHTHSNIVTCVEEGECWLITCVCVKWICLSLARQSLQSPGCYMHPALG